MAAIATGIGPAALLEHPEVCEMVLELLEERARDDRRRALADRLREVR